MRIKLSSRWSIKVKHIPGLKDAREIKVYKNKILFEEVICHKDNVINYIMLYGEIAREEIENEKGRK